MANREKGLPLVNNVFTFRVVYANHFKKTIRLVDLSKCPDTSVPDNAAISALLQEISQAKRNRHPQSIFKRKK